MYALVAALHNVKATKKLNQKLIFVVESLAACAQSHPKANLLFMDEYAACAHIFLKSEMFRSQIPEDEANRKG